MNKIKTLVITTVAAVGITVVGTGIIHAAQTTNGRTDYMSSLVSAIAQKFNLSQSDVQKVFDEQKQVMQTQMQTDRVAQQKNVLDQDVKNGKITQTQEDAIIAKQKEVQTFMDSLKDKSQTDRESAMKTETTSLQQWAKDNSIDEHYVMLGRGGRGPGMGPRGGMQDPAARLAQDVKDGKITQAQSDLITAKQKEVQTFMDSLKDKSQTDRESAMKTETTSLQQWAKDNSIDEHYVMLGRGGRGPGMGQPGQDVPPPTDNATTN